MPRGRPREFDRDAALRIAMLVFWRKGFNATSIPDLCTAMGIRSPSLYAAFGSKEALYVEAVGLYMREIRSTFWRYLDGGPSARSGLRDLLKALSGELTRCDTHPAGCFITVATPDEDMPAPVVAAIRAARQAWLQVIRDHLAGAIAGGELPATANVDALSRFYQGIVQTIGIQSHDGATAAELDGVVDTAMAVWPAHAPGAGAAG